MKTIKCKYCGKSYASPSEMRKRKCRSHPKGAWGGCCEADPAEIPLYWVYKRKEKDVEDAADQRRKTSNS